MCTFPDIFLSYCRFSVLEVALTACKIGLLLDIWQIGVIVGGILGVIIIVATIFIVKKKHDLNKQLKLMGKPIQN